MNKKKVLMTASVWAHIHSFHIPYLKAFRQLGWETHVACAGLPGEPPYVDTAIEVPFEKKMTSPENFRAALLLRRRIRAERYDLIITHTTLASFFTRLAVWGMPGRPKLVNVMHGYLFDDETPAMKRRVLLTAERITAPQTDLLLVMNAWDLETAQKYRLGRRIEKIPGMGVNFTGLDGAMRADGQKLRKTHGIAEDAFVLLYAAEFSPRKSQWVLIRAMCKLPENVVLALCGDGAKREECRALAQQLGVSERVLLPGHVQDMPAWYKMADACVTASRSEGLPFNVIEAMRAGLPVVASAVKGHEDLIDDGVNGLLYPYADAESCAKQVARLMHDAALCQALGARAAQDARRYALDGVLPAVMDLYMTAMK